MAGERLWLTGQPRTPNLTNRCTGPRPRRRAAGPSPCSERGPWAGPSLAARRVLAAELVALAVVGGDVALELRVGGGERVRAVGARAHDVEQVADVRGLQRGLDGGQTRVADRRRRQALVHARVVGRVALQLGLT